jgi:hypothetical protein
MKSKKIIQLKPKYVVDRGERQNLLQNKNKNVFAPQGSISHMACWTDKRSAKNSLAISYATIKLYPMHTTILSLSCICLCCAQYHGLSADEDRMLENGKDLVTGSTPQYIGHGINAISRVHVDGFSIFHCLVLI